MFSFVVGSANVTTATFFNHFLELIPFQLRNAGRIEAGFAAEIPKF